MPNESLPKPPSSNPTSTTNIPGIKLEIKTEPGNDGNIHIKSEPDDGSGSNPLLPNIKSEDIKQEIKQEPSDIKPSINSTNR